MMDREAVAKEMFPAAYAESAIGLKPMTDELWAQIDAEILRRERAHASLRPMVERGVPEGKSPW